jgi:hypothetical protein
MNKLLAVALLTVVLPACSSDSPPGAAVAKDATLTDSPLARLENVSLLRAGDGFVLAGYDAGFVHWARLSLDGEVVPPGVASFALAQPAVGPVFAVTRKSSPGDQLVALALVRNASNGFDLVATVHTFGDPAPAAPFVLGSPDWFPTGTDPSLVSLIAGAAASGNVGYVAWGIRANHLPIFYLLLPADAKTTAKPATFLDAEPRANVPPWDCLAPQSRPTGLSFGATVTPGEGGIGTSFLTVDIDEGGNTSTMSYPVLASVINCHIVGAPAAADGSYYIALQGMKDGSSAVDFATYYPRPALDGGEQGGDVNTRHPVLPAAQYGDATNLPYPAWVSSAGAWTSSAGDVVIGLVRKSGPEVVRFTYNNIPHGSTLRLRSVNGQAGPVAAWVGEDAVYVTYADLVKSGGAKRYFMRIVSPATLP